MKWMPIETAPRDGTTILLMSEKKFLEDIKDELMETHPASYSYQEYIADNVFVGVYGTDYYPEEYSGKWISGFLYVWIKEDDESYEYIADDTGYPRMVILENMTHWAPIPSLSQFIPQK